MRNGSFLIFFLIVSQLAFAQRTSVGVFKQHTDIGHPKNPGTATYDKSTKAYNIKGSGYNIWFNRDEFQYVYNKVKGDFTVTAHFEFVGGKGNGHRKIGWMMRETADEDAVHASAVLHGDGLTVLQWRSKKGENMKDPEGEIFFPEKAKFEIVQLQREGKKVTMKVGHPGQPLQTVGSHEMPDVPDEVLIGLFICSHDPEVTEEAIVTDVKIEKKASK